jgi:4-amino-4-deoxy-L-arabinose transferase-like glycosyltransferase
MNRRIALSIMVFCLLLAAALRLPELTATPPGLHYDEAANGILAGDISQRGQRPLFIASYTGKEVLFFYLAAGVMKFAGESVFALRLAAAYIGLLTIAATYWLGRMLLSDRRLALMAAGLLAVSFWHVLFSRLGFRAISQPLLQALTIGALFAGLRQSSWRPSWPWLLLAGVSLGLTAYTYLAARFFPIALLFGLLPLLLGSQQVRLRLRQLALFLLAGMVVLAPLAIYFVYNPDAFWVRAGQVLPEGSRLASLLDSYAKSLAAFFLEGDPYWRFNIPGRPLLYPLWGLLLLAGWLYAALKWFKQTIDWRRSAYLLLVVMPLVMVLPEALAIGDIVPSNLRAIGLLPFVYFLPAIGFLLLVRLARRAWQARPFGRRRVAFVLSQLLARREALWAFSVALVLLVGGVTTGRAYFDEWANRADVFYETDGDLAAVSSYLDATDLSGQNVYLAALHYRHPTVAFLSKYYDVVRWLPEGQALVFRADQPGLYVYPHNSPLPDWAAGFMPAEAAVEGPLGPDGQPAFVAYEVPQPPDIAPPNLINANFANQVTVFGYELTEPVSGDTLPLTLYWQVQAPPAGDLMPFAHLEDAWGYRWGQVESFAYPAEQWLPGDTVIQQIELPLREGMPPGDYRLRLGFFDAGSDEQLPYLDEGGRYAGNALTIDDVTISTTWPLKETPVAPNVLDLEANADLRLLGYERAEQRVAAGASFWLSLWWAAQEPLESMHTRLSLIGPDNSGRIILNSPPVRGGYPFDEWSTPNFIIDHLTPKVPADMPPGDYVVAMSLLDGGDQTVLTADLGQITVEAADRLFKPPVTEFPLQATFGGEIALLGYDMRPVEPGKVELTLVWQAISEPAGSYTVFLHVLDPDGVCCVWQQDVIPGQGTYATDRWLPGEVVIDTYLIDLPQDLAAGAYPIEVGLYLPHNGQRLLVTMPGLRDNDVLYLWPLEIE